MDANDGDPISRPNVVFKRLSIRPNKNMSFSSSTGASILAPYYFFIWAGIASNTAIEVKMSYRVFYTDA